MSDRLEGNLSIVTARDSSTSGSMKRNRALRSGVHVPSCLVDGCTSDLSKCRDYHRRHKVCELHSKAPIVTIKGQERRFCQQCSRFHSLVEFDDGKRSCRKRLDGHNRRRRKPQPEPVPMSSGRLLPNYQGSSFLALNGTPLFSTVPLASSSRSEAVKADNDSVLCNSHSQFNFSTRNMLVPESLCDKEEKKLLSSQSTKYPGYSACSLDLDSNYMSGNVGGCQKVSSDGLTQSDCALSLLSSTTTGGTQEVALGHMKQPGSVPSVPSFLPGLHFSGLVMGGEPVSAAVVSSGSSYANLHCQGMFPAEPNGSSSGDHHQKLFSWE